MTKQASKPKKTSAEKEMLAILSNSENGSEMKVILRDTFLEVNPDGQRLLKMPTQPHPDDESITFNKQTIQHLINSGTVTEAVGNALLSLFDNHEKKINLSNKSSDKSLNVNIEQTIHEEIAKEASQVPLQLQAMRQLFDIDGFLNKNKNHQILFKKNVYSPECIGITKALMDRLYYLPELLNQAELFQTSSGEFIVTAKLENSDKSVGEIGLEYILPTKDAETALAYFNEYVSDMRTDALNVFLAYWAAANDEGFYNYLAPLSDIIRHTLPNPHRRPSTNEKKRFWTLSKLLINTKITLTIKTTDYVTIKHPLLVIPMTASKENGQEKKKGYPDKVRPRVLDPNEFKKSATLATEISRRTIQLRGEDIQLAVNFQTKASQHRTSKDPLIFDELKLMEWAGLVKTYNANPRVARQRLAKKLNNNKAAGSIEGWSPSKSKIIIHKRQDVSKAT